MLNFAPSRPIHSILESLSNPCPHKANVNPVTKIRQDLEEVQSSHDEFRSWVLAHVKETPSPTASSSKEDNKKKEDEQPKRLPSIQEALSQATTYEEACGFIEPFSTINEIENAKRAHSELSRKRAHGTRRLGHGLQKFSVTFLQYLRAFRGIVNIAASADPGFVGLAYETLNILFTVSVPIRFTLTP